MGVQLTLGVVVTIPECYDLFSGAELNVSFYFRNKRQEERKYVFSECSLEKIKEKTIQEIMFGIFECVCVCVVGGGGGGGGDIKIRNKKAN